MTDLLIFAIFFALLAIICVYRLVKGPTAADRMVAADNADILLCCAMILFSLFSVTCLKHEIRDFEVEDHFSSEQEFLDSLQVLL